MPLLWVSQILHLWVCASPRVYLQGNKQYRNIICIYNVSHLCKAAPTVIFLLISSPFLLFSSPSIFPLTIFPSLSTFSFCVWHPILVQTSNQFDPAVGTACCLCKPLLTSGKHCVTDVNPRVSRPSRQDKKAGEDIKLSVHDRSAFILHLETVRKELLRRHSHFLARETPLVAIGSDIRFPPVYWVLAKILISPKNVIVHPVVCVTLSIKSIDSKISSEQKVSSNTVNP